MLSPNVFTRGFAASALFIAVAAGCDGRKYDPSNAPVEGQAKWKDGTDAGGLGGTVEFEADGNVVAKTELNSDGTFTMDKKLPAGKYRVRVVAPPPAADAEYQMDAKHQKFETSGLTVNVTDETPQRINLVLTRFKRANRE